MHDHRRCSQDAGRPRTSRGGRGRDDATSVQAQVSQAHVSHSSFSQAHTSHSHVKQTQVRYCCIDWCCVNDVIAVVTLLPVLAGGAAPTQLPRQRARWVRLDTCCMHLAARWRAHRCLSPASLSVHGWISHVTLWSSLERRENSTVQTL